MKMIISIIGGMSILLVVVVVGIGIGTNWTYRFGEEEKSDPQPNQENLEKQDADYEGKRGSKEEYPNAETAAGWASKNNNPPTLTDLEIKAMVFGMVYKDEKKVLTDERRNDEQNKNYIPKYYYAKNFQSKKMKEIVKELENYLFENKERIDELIDEWTKQLVTPSPSRTSSPSPSSSPSPASQSRTPSPSSSPSPASQSRTPSPSSSPSSRTPSPSPASQSPSSPSPSSSPSSRTPSPSPASSRESRTPAGLVNTGNTCYMNAALQVLLHSKVFMKEFVFNESLYLQSEMLSSFSELSKQMDAAKESIDPVEIRNEIYKALPTFNNGGQHCSDECIQGIINQIKEELTADGNKGEIINKAFGIYTYGSRTCDLCNNVRADANVDLIYRIALPIKKISSGKKITSLEDGLNAKYLELESLTKNNYDCSNTNCRSKSGKEKTTVYSFPHKILLIYIMRVNESICTDICHDPVEFEYSMNLKKYIKNPLLDRVDVIFSLSGVVIHTGSTTNSGHYIACCKVGDNWYEFDDTHVQKVNTVDLKKRVKIEGSIFLYERK